MITAIIPARGGSKRLPGKNVRLLAGRPLIFHTIDAVLNHPAISRIIFTTDSDAYINLVRTEYDDQVAIIKRPTEYASDKAKVYDEVVRLAQIGEISTEWFLTCLPTAPLRNHVTVEKLLAEWTEEPTPRFSVSKYSFPIQFAFDIDDDGDWRSIFADSPMVTGKTRSQDIPPRYRPNGAMYLQKTVNLESNKTFYIDAKPFLISEVESTDVDTEIDFALAEILLYKQRQPV